MEKIKLFLKQSHSYLKSNSFSKIKFVLNNTSCDMDSVISSILLSFVMNIKHEILKSNNELSILKNDIIYLPLINCKNNYFAGRLDINFILKFNGISDLDLIFFDEIIGSTEYKDLNYKLILVDHNKLDHSQEFLNDKVIGIYDHHQDSLINYPNLKEKYIIFPIGSCSTIILLNHYICDENIMSLFKNQYLELLCSAIWLDTKGFSASDKNIRWSDLDLFTYNQLKEIGKIDEKIFSELVNTKYDVKANLNLGLDCLMNKDLKNFSYKLKSEYNLLNKNNIIKEDNQILVTWASLQIEYSLIIEHFGEEVILDYYKEKKCQMFVTNSRYKDQFILITILFNFYDEKFNKDMEKYFIDDFIKSTDIVIKEVLETNIPSYYCFLLKLNTSRKILEVVFKKILQSN